MTIKPQHISEAVGGVAAETSFSGVVRVDVGGVTMHHAAYGLADRAHEIPMTTDTRIAIASGGKVFTALAALGLVQRGVIGLHSEVRQWLGDDLPLIEPTVTVEQLLSHRSGIGDYLNEDAVESISDYVMPCSVHLLADTESFLGALDGHPMVSAPGERFTYNNGGFVVIALVVERASGLPYHQLVAEQVITPGRLQRTAFLRTDELPGDAAVGYLHANGLRHNGLHLPVLATGDGGIYSTADDIHRLWQALLAGDIIDTAGVDDMVTPRHHGVDGELSYGLGLWLRPESDALILEGYDAGASFRSVHQPSTRTTWSVLSNSSEGAWPIARVVGELLAT